MHSPLLPVLLLYQSKLLILTPLVSEDDKRAPGSVTLISTISPFVVPTTTAVLLWFQEQQVREVEGEMREVDTICCVKMLRPSLAATSCTCPSFEQVKKNPPHLDHCMSVMFGRFEIRYSNASTPALFFQRMSVPQLSQVTIF